MVQKNRIVYIIKYFNSFQINDLYLIKYFSYIHMRTSVILTVMVINGGNGNQNQCNFS